MIAAPMNALSLFRKILISAAALAVFAPRPATAMWRQGIAPFATLEFRYREAITPDEDMATLHRRMLNLAERDCRAATEAYSRHCFVSAITFNVNSFTDPISREETNVLWSTITLLLSYDAEAR